MRYHVLNGDSLGNTFPEAKIPGDTVVVREALMDGNLSGKTLEAFWQTRANYIGIPDDEYHKAVATEFEKIINAPAGTEFNLWFEYDLFCQVNMWFVLSLIQQLPGNKKVFAVYTTHLNKDDKNFWNGFGPAKAENLRFCFDHRVELNDADLQSGTELWNAYKNNDLDKLGSLAEQHSSAFPYLKDVISAHIDRFPTQGRRGRPERVIEEITKNISTDFNKVFQEFWKRESIYGFGDVQLKKIYDEVMHQK